MGNWVGGTFLLVGYTAWNSINRFKNSSVLFLEDRVSLSHNQTWPQSHRLWGFRIKRNRIGRGDQRTQGQILQCGPKGCRHVRVTGPNSYSIGVPGKSTLHKVKVAFRVPVFLVYLLLAISLASDKRLFKNSVHPLQRIRMFQWFARYHRVSGRARIWTLTKLVFRITAQYFPHYMSTVPSRVYEVTQECFVLGNPDYLHDFLNTISLMPSQTWLSKALFIPRWKMTKLLAFPEYLQFNRNK